MVCTIAAGLLVGLQPASNAALSEHVGDLGAAFVSLLVAAAIFVATSLRFPVLRRQALIAGPLFGVCIYVVMHFVIVPLSHAPPSSPKGIQFVEEFLGHMFVIGLPIALWARALVGKD